jgi:hypothetical protein
MKDNGEMVSDGVKEYAFTKMGLFTREHGNKTNIRVLAE